MLIKIGVLVALLFVTVFVALYLGNGYNYSEEVFILPEGYRGAVYVLHNRQDGKEKEYAGKNRIFDIPPSGILKTQFDFGEPGTKEWKFYFKHGSDRGAIPYSLEETDSKKDEVHVCCLSFGVSLDDRDDTEVPYTKFFVGTDSEIRGAIIASEKIHIADLVNQ